MGMSNHTSLCPRCLTIRRCECPVNRIYLGAKKPAELISQAQGNRKKIIKILEDVATWKFYRPEYWLKDVLIVYLEGFPTSEETISIGAAKWQRMLESDYHRAHQVSEYYYSGKDKIENVERYLIKGKTKYKVKIV